MLRFTEQLTHSKPILNFFSRVVALAALWFVLYSIVRFQFRRVIKQLSFKSPLPSLWIVKNVSLHATWPKTKVSQRFFILLIVIWPYSLSLDPFNMFVVLSQCYGLYSETAVRPVRSQGISKFCQNSLHFCVWAKKPVVLSQDEGRPRFKPKNLSPG